MKKSIIISVCIVLVSMLKAQNTPDGFYLLRMKQYKAAKSYFDNKITENPLNAEMFYGLGEYYYALGNTDSAQLYFQKSLTINKKFALGNVGLCKIAYEKRDSVNTSIYYETAIKLGKKDANVFIALAKIFVPGNIAKANDLLAQSKVLDSKCSDYYLLKANIALLDQNNNEAANNFESAVFFDSTKFEAYISIARIYLAAQNSQYATEYLLKLLQKAPYCLVGERELGDIYFKLGKYQDAKKYYQKYLINAEYTSDDKEKYAYILFFSKDYDQAKHVIEELSNNNPDNYIMLRLLAYTHYEKAEIAESLEMFNKLFSRIPANKVLSIDYEYYARALEKSGADSLAAIAYSKAFSLDTTKGFLLDETAREYTKAKVYDKAVDYYNLSFSRKEKLQPSDYFQLARANYYAGFAIQSPADSIRKETFLEKADTLFGTVYSLNPKSHLGLLWKARTNSILDPETTKGLAKPYYDKVYTDFFALNSDKFKKEIVEVYSYLGFYYYQKNEYPVSKEYWAKILEIDPQNATASEALKGFKKQ